MPQFNLNDYIDVQTRINRFWTENPDGAIRTQHASDPHDFEVCRYRAEVYKHRDSTAPDAVGYAFERAGSGMANKTSHEENCETSAIGRALANMGYATSGKDRPSQEEMQKAVDTATSTQTRPQEGATGSPRHETPRQGSAPATPSGSAQRPNTDAGSFDTPQLGTGGPATKPQKGRLWHMSGKDDSVVAAWAAEYGETLDTLTKGTASLLIDTKGGE